MIVSLENISMSFGSALVLKDITARIDDDSRIGLIGVNGAGKSTLLKIIYGELEPEEGTASRGGKRIGFLRQDSGLSPGRSIREEMRCVFEHLFEMEAEMRQLESEMSEAEGAGPRHHELLLKYNRLQEAFEAAEGYHIDVKISTVLGGMGFGETDPTTPVDVLSGGERTRLAICKLLLEAPELLILDEPTNHLDFKTLIWLEEYLRGYKGAILVVSHDRYFLDQICASIWEIEHHCLHIYRGNYSRYLLLKEERIERLQKEYEAQQQEIADMKDFIARNLTRASTTGRAKSRRRALERMEPAEAPKLPPKPPVLRFGCRREPVKDLLHITGMSLSVGEGGERKKLFSGLDLDVFKGEKLAIIGANGIGKTSFLKAILGLIPKDSGRVEWGQGADISLFEQGEEGMNGSRSAIDELWDAFPRETELTIRSMLGRAGITGENVYKKVSSLSGGEKARLKFARLMMLEGNVLLMDEPTNHLDLATKEALDKALAEFEGTLLVISHDRYLLNKFPDKIVEMHGSGVTTYIGRYDDYIERKKSETTISAAPVERQKKEEKVQAGYRTKKQRSDAVALRKRIQELEEKIEALEGEIWNLEQEISLPEVASDYLLMREKCDILEQKRLELNICVDEWSELGEEIST